MTTRGPTTELRRGWTTGACATAAAVAAYRALLTGGFADGAITITLPRGQEPTFDLVRREIADGRATASVIKDAGDDPDVTHGCEVVVTVTPGPAGSGVTFRAGDGVGTVTLPGLPLQVGEPAVNPAPRAMIRAAIAAIAAELGDAGDLVVTIAIPGGQEMAAKTMNGRLGILGGLSVLGTTGVVIPYSCASWIHSIHRGVDVARGQGIDHLIAATGSTSEQAARERYGAREQALIDMGDFAGGLLKYLRSHPVPRLTLAGGFAKLAKLGQGHLDLHSSRSSLDMGRLADLAAPLGADAADRRAITGANTGLAALEHARRRHLPLAHAVARSARETALATLSGGTRVEVLVYDRQGCEVGHAGF